MERFYKVVCVGPAEGGYCVLLDAKPVRTPANNLLKLPTEQLANAIANEWQSQTHEISPQSMPLLRLANTIIDSIDANRAEVIDALIRIGRNDLLCYRAFEPSDLVVRQVRNWDPVLAWVKQRFDAQLKVTQGLMHVDQSLHDFEKIRQIVDGYDVFTLGALHVIASITGSLLLALAVAEGHLLAGEAFRLSRLDELYQAEKWGSDSVAQKRAKSLEAEVEKAAELILTVRP